MPHVFDREHDITDISDDLMDQQVAQDLQHDAASYVRIKDRIAEMEKEKNRLRDGLLAMIGTYGYEMDKGNLGLDLPRKVGGVSVLVRQRRATQKLREREAEDLLRSRGLWEACTVETRVLNEDAIMDALRDGSLTPADIDEMFETKESFALVTKR